MAVPVLSPAVDNPINIDAGIAYTYVIPSTGETSLGFTPNANFTLSLTGRSLTVKFIGSPPLIATVFPVSIYASNGEGTVEQTLNFQVSAPAKTITELPNKSFANVYAGIRLLAGFSNGSANISGLVSVDPFNPSALKSYLPNAVLRVGDIVLCGTNTNWNSSATDSHFDNKVLYVVAVTSTNFQLSATPGGAAVSALANISRYIYVGFGANTTDTFWVGETSLLTVGDKVRFDYTANNAAPGVQGTKTTVPPVPTQLSGLLYIKTIVDGFHVKLSLTNGGAAITASADYPVAQRQPDVLGSPAWPPSDPVKLVISVLSQLYPDITSAGETDVALSAAVSYTVTTDIVADSITTQGLPSFLSIAGAVISGTAPASNSLYVVTLIATKGSVRTRRYWYLKVGTGGAIGAGSGSIPVVTPPAALNLTVGLPIRTGPFAATNSPTSWSMVSLPPGLSCDSPSGVVTGTPTDSGTYISTVTARNAAGDSDPVQVTWAVAAASTSGGGGGGGGSGGGSNIIDVFALARRRGSDLVFLVDLATKTLVSSPESQTPAQLPPFFQGDKINVDLYFLTPTGDIFAPYEFKTYAVTPAIRVGIGKILGATGGTFKIIDGAQTTAAIAFGATAAAVQSAIRAALTTRWASAVVTGNDGGPWTIDRGVAGNVNQLTADVGNISPDSVAIISTRREGTGSVNELQQIKIQQLAAAYQDVWTPIGTAGSILSATIQDGFQAQPIFSQLPPAGGTVSKSQQSRNEIQRIGFTQVPLGGEYTLTFERGVTQPISANASQAQIQAACDAALGAGAVTITAVPGVSITIQFNDYADHSDVVIDATNIAWTIGYSGTISLDTLGIDQLLGTSAKVTDALLEIEVTADAAPGPETVIQREVTVTNDMLEGAAYGSTPNPTAKPYPNVWFRSDLQSRANLATVPTVPLVGSDNGNLLGQIIQFLNTSDGDGPNLETYVLIDDPADFLSTTDFNQPTDGVQPADFDASTNPKLWALISRVCINSVDGFGALFLPESGVLQVPLLSVSGAANAAVLVTNVSTITYSASMTPDASLANGFIITATNGTAFTINAPLGSGSGQEISVTIRNTSGGALGAATWNAVFKLSAWTQPANGFSRSIRFRFKSPNWVELSRTPADVPN